MVALSLLSPQISTTAGLSVPATFCLTLLQVLVLELTEAEVLVW